MTFEHSEPGRKLLYVVSEDHVFLLHVRAMARAARKAGFEVHVATHVGNRGPLIEAEGFTLHRIPFSRGRNSPIAAIQTILALRRLEHTIKPDLIHHSSLQCCIYGSIAALGKNILHVNGVTGLGYLFTGIGWRTLFFQKLLAVFLPRLFSRKCSTVLVQNPDDQETLCGFGIAKNKIACIPGAGVDTDNLQPLAEPNDTLAVGFAGRLLIDKGILVLLAAHQMLRNQGHDINLLIAGSPDPANPTSVTAEQAQSWNRRPGVKWLGYVDGIALLWKQCHIAVLPSRREGLPMSLLEAAACGRPMIATDVPGCREIVIQDHTGLLVPIDDPAALSEAILDLAKSQQLRIRYGHAARNLAVEKLSVGVIGKSIVGFYDSLFRTSSSFLN